jgi:hypothetical protein
MSFPNFPNEEIADAIQNFGYPSDLSPGDVSKPTVSKMMLIYEWFLLYFASITRDDIRNAVMEPLLNILHPVSPGVLKTKHPLLPLIKSI